MKTIALIVSILTSILFSNVLVAQEKNEFKVAYGYSGIDFTYTAIPIGEGPHDATSGTLSINYNRRITNRISVGVQTNYTRIILKSTEPVPGIEPSENRVYSDPKHIVYPLAKIDFRYINKPEFEMYSSAMVGFFSIDDGFPCHFTGLGFRVGAKHAFVGELGFGFGQLVSVGYSIKI